MGRWNGQFGGIKGIDLQDETAGEDKYFVKSYDKARQNIKNCCIVVSK